MPRSVGRLVLLAVVTASYPPAPDNHQIHLGLVCELPPKQSVTASALRKHRINNERQVSECPPGWNALAYLDLPDVVRGYCKLLAG